MGLVGPRFVIYLARAVAGAVLLAAPEGQPDDHLGRVVRLAPLEDPVPGIGDVDEGEAAAQPAHVHPLLDVCGRIDVGPADRGADHLTPLLRVRVAGGIDAVARRAAKAGVRVAQVPQAVGDLHPVPDEAPVLAAMVETPELEAGRPVELPVVQAPMAEGVAEAGAGTGGDVAAAAPVDALRRAHEAPAHPAPAKLGRATADVVDRVARTQQRPSVRVLEL